MSTYMTKDGDTVDFIAWNYYGATNTDAIVQILNANPGLAGQGPILPAGVIVALPVIDKTVQIAGVRLWD